MTTNDMPEVNIFRANSRIRRLKDQLATSERLLQALRDKLADAPHDMNKRHSWNSGGLVNCACWKAGL